MADAGEVNEKLNEAAIALAEKAKGAPPSGAIQYAYAAAALALAVRNVPFSGSYGSGS